MDILPPSELRHCHTCRWGWHFDDAELPPEDCMGECHRHAPQPFTGYLEAVDDVHAHWPVVHGSQGCGDWSTRWGV